MECDANNDHKKYRRRRLIGDEEREEGTMLIVLSLGNLQNFYETYPMVIFASLAKEKNDRDINLGIISCA